MSEGEGGYRPPQDSTTSRRTFLKDMFKVGAGVAAGAVGAEVLSSKPSKTPETTPAAQEPKEVLLEITNKRAITPQFQILHDKNLPVTGDMGRIHELPVAMLGDVAVSIAQRMLDRTLKGDEPVSKQQREQIEQIILDFDSKMSSALLQSNNPTK